MADDDDLLVTISGPALALLLYENSRTTEQFGFLLGKVLTYVTKRVTDSDRDVHQSKNQISIETLVAYPKGSPFFNTPGYLYEDKLDQLLGENKKKVVGWYHYRDEFPLNPTLRDYKLHHELSKFFVKTCKFLTKQNFIFCLLNSEQSRICGTHKFKQLLLHKNRADNFTRISLNINNLGSDAAMPDGSDYKPTPKYTSCESDAFDLVYKQVRSNLEDRSISDVQRVQVIQKGAEHLLEKIIQKVEESDKIVSELESKLQELREKKKAACDQVIFEGLYKMEVDARSESKTPDNLGSSQDIFESPKVRNAACDIIDHKLTSTKSLNFDPYEYNQKRESSPASQDYLTYSSTQDRNISRNISNLALRGSSPITNAQLFDSGDCSTSSLDRNKIQRGSNYRYDLPSESIPTTSKAYIIPSSDNDSEEL